MPSALSLSTSTTRRIPSQPALDQHDSADNSTNTSSRSRSRKTNTNTADVDSSSPRRSRRLNRGSSNTDMLDGETSELIMRDLRRNKEFMDGEESEELDARSEFEDREKDYANG